MRTKALLLAAAFTVATSATAMAQVYSANAVGYVNVDLPAGFNLVANPLQAEDDSLTTVLPLGSGQGGNLARFYTFDRDIQNFTGAATWLDAQGQWLPARTLAPGQAGFLDLPTAMNLTFVGEVPQGAASNSDLVPGFNMVGSTVPQALPLGTPGTPNTLEFPAENLDRIYIFVNDGVNPPGYQGVITYLAAQNIYAPGAPQGPTIPVAGGFFVDKGSAANWDRNFSVN